MKKLYEPKVKESRNTNVPRHKVTTKPRPVSGALCERLKIVMQEENKRITDYYLTKL